MVLLGEAQHGYTKIPREAELRAWPTASARVLAKSQERATRAGKSKGTSDPGRATSRMPCGEVLSCSHWALAKQENFEHFSVFSQEVFQCMIGGLRAATNPWADRGVGRRLSRTQSENHVTESILWKLGPWRMGLASRQWSLREEAGFFTCLSFPFLSPPHFLWTDRWLQWLPSWKPDLSDTHHAVCGITHPWDKEGSDAVS